MRSRHSALRFAVNRVGSTTRDALHLCPQLHLGRAIGLQARCERLQISRRAQDEQRARQALPYLTLGDCMVSMQLVDAVGDAEKRRMEWR